MRSLFLTALMVLATAVAAVAQPRTVTFQGRARDAAGAFPDDERRITIRIFDAATGGTALFTESHTVRFRQGAFTVVIGGATSGGIPPAIAFDRPMWLEATIQNFNGGSPLAPRMQFHSAPSAISAIEADSSRAAGYAGSAGRADSLAPGTSIVVDVVEAETSAGSTGAPGAGTLFRDNVPMAWGLVAADGTIYSDFGITSVTKNGRGQYVVLLDNAAATVTDPKLGAIPALAPTIMPTLLGDIGQPLSAGWSFVGGSANRDREISVVTYASPNGEPVPTDLAFSIIVFGRPAQ